VTSTLVFEGDGRAGEYVGGYADWLRVRDDDRRAAGARRPETARPNAPSTPGAAVSSGAPPAAPPIGRRQRLPCDEQREIDALDLEVLDAYTRWAEPDARR
jgi:ATP-binding cassette subfamily F protein uup